MFSNRYTIDHPVDIVNLGELQTVSFKLLNFTCCMSHVSLALARTSQRILSSL